MPCIYCGANEKLTVSDIIPDALTNRRITNKFVCKKHNNPFGETFENDVIKALAPITNALCIKSSKAKYYQSYDHNVTVGGIEYKAKSAKPLFYNSSLLSSDDNTHKMGDLNVVEKIKAVKGGTVTEIVPENGYTESVTLDLNLFNSRSMHRLIAKIAFEWYCKYNDIQDHLSEFDPIIDFISGEDNAANDPVTIRNNCDLYYCTRKFTDLGNYILDCYLGTNDSVNISISFLGLVIYNVKVLDKAIEGCKYNALFQLITIDGKEYHFSFETVEKVTEEFQKHTREVQLDNGTRALCCDSKDINIQLYFRNICAYLHVYELLQKTNDLSAQASMNTIVLIRQAIHSITFDLSITPQYLKRFINDRFEDIKQGVTLISDPGEDAWREVFTFYVLFICGKNYDDISCFDDLNKLLRKETEIYSKKGTLLARQCTKCMMKDSDYPELIKKGADKIIMILS